MKNERLIVPDYENRYKRADEFSKSRPTFAKALEFGRRPEIGFSNYLDNGKVRFGNSADAGGVLTAMIGEEALNRLRGIKDGKISPEGEDSVIYIEEKGENYVITLKDRDKGTLYYREINKNGEIVDNTRKSQ